MEKLVLCFLVFTIFLSGFLYSQEIKDDLEDNKTILDEDPTLIKNEEPIQIKDIESNQADSNDEEKNNDISKTKKGISIVREKENDDISWKYLISVGLPLLILVVTNAIQLSKIYLESKESNKRNLLFESLEIRRKQLSSFYDPIIALLKTNNSLFTAFGPRTFPAENYMGEEAKDIWNHLVETVILVNNEEIINTIKSMCHLIDIEDDIEKYYNYMKHAISYRAFRYKRNELHQKFPFPNDFLENVEKNRREIYSSIKKDEEFIKKGRRK